MSKRTQVAPNEDSILEKTVLSPISKGIQGMHPRSGKSTLESRQSRILSWSEGPDVAIDTISDADAKRA